MATLWSILFRVVWVGLVLLSSVMTLFMFAFADSPDAGKAAQNMIAPIFVITLALFAVSATLLMRGTWWSIPASYVMVIAPPFLIFLGYNLLMK
jgi:hypothetical protein